jgi:hypothetical protein
VKFQVRYGIVLFLILLCAGGVVFYLASSGEDIPALGDKTEDNGVVTEEKPEEILPFICPFDGIRLKEMPFRPVAVTIDNLTAARPQSGLRAADLIYEIPAEGGITRFLALYFHGQADKIGPIRSARPYFVRLAQEWHGVYIHAGESPQAQIYFKNEDVDHINEMFNPQGFWRDKTRKAPHNLYSSSENLWQETVKRGWDEKVDITGFSFLSEGEVLKGEEADQVIINYPFEQVVFKKDSLSGQYQRFLGNKPHIDKETGEQLTAANIIVQETKVRVLDNEGRLEIELAGEGRAWLFSGGKAVEGRWIKNGEERTQYIDADGNEFCLKPGQTWIEIVSKSNKVEY